MTPVRLRPEIAALPPYRQGKQASPDAFKLSSNENPFEPLPAVVEALRAGRCDLVVNSPQGSGARRDGARIRHAALAARVPCITTMAAARLAVEAIAGAQDEHARSLQERLERELGEARAA